MDTKILLATTKEIDLWEKIVTLRIQNGSTTTAAIESADAVCATLQKHQETPLSQPKKYAKLALSLLPSTITQSFLKGLLDNANNALHSTESTYTQKMLASGYTLEGLELMRERIIQTLADELFPVGETKETIGLEDPSDEEAITIPPPIKIQAHTAEELDLSDKSVEPKAPKKATTKAKVKKTTQAADVVTKSEAAALGTLSPVEIYGMLASMLEDRDQQSSSTIDEILDVVGSANRKPTITLFKMLDDVSAGTYKLGRKGKPTRIEWSDSTNTQALLKSWTTDFFEGVLKEAE